MTAEADIGPLLREAVARYNAMSPVDKALLHSDQRRSFVRGQIGRDPGPDVLAEEVRRLRAENTALRQECAVEKERASVLLEAAWEVMSQFGVTDTTVDEILIPAILKADGDPEYARTTIAEMRAAFPDDHHLRARLLKERDDDPKAG